MRVQLIISALVATVSAASNGIKACNVTAEKISKAMGGENVNMGYKFECFAKGCDIDPKTKTLKLKLLGEKKFKGLALYVTDLQGNGRYGTFQSYPTNDYRGCGTNCGNSSELMSMLTHREPTYKNTGIEIIWGLGKNEPCKDYLLMFALVQQMEDWQFMHNITLKCKAKPPPIILGIPFYESSYSSLDKLSKPKMRTPKAILNSNKRSPYYRPKRIPFHIN